MTTMFKTIENTVKFWAKRLTALIQHPFPLLLWVEWFLLAINLVDLVEIPLFFEIGSDFPLEETTDPLPWMALPPITTVGLLILFAGLGLFIPQRQLWRKILYTLMEIGLLSLAALSLGCWDCFSWSLVVVVIRSCVLFRLPGRLVTAGSIFVLFLGVELITLVLWRDEIVIDIVGAADVAEASEIPAFSEQNLYSFLWQEQLETVLFLGLILVFVLLLTGALTSERQGRNQLTMAHEQLRQYALRVEAQATVEERNRIAREIHDSLGHLLTAQKIQLNNALAFLPDKPSDSRVKPFLEEGKQLGVEALQELRRSLKILRSDPLQAMSLHRLLQDMVTRFADRVDAIIDCQLQLDMPVSDEVKRAVYRIVEEALNNACKYSAADQIVLRVQIHASSNELLFQILDNGRGFAVAQNTSGFGLRGMKERALALNGDLLIQSWPGAGCKISGRLPLGLLPRMER
ncbi:MAG: sensor histidine kinase [Cyanobacteria bacterium P01_H01_bin.21]